MRGIEPHETAFVIPNFGKTTDQAQYRSEAYLNRPEVKVPGKFIIIPHEKLSGTGGSSGLSGALSSDYYISTVTVIKVVRSSYAREWVQKGRGSNSAIDESFPCQTKGGHNIDKIGTSIGVRIDDENAARYLANFGLQPVSGDPDAIQTIFTSVRYARPLTDVTDHVVRQKVQTLICEKIAEYADPVVASAAMKDIMGSVREDAKAFLAGFGITLEFLGWADTWTFDTDVQMAINQKFIATQVAESLDVLQRNAVINTLEGLGTGFKKGGPNFLVIPEKLFDLIRPGTPPIMSVAPAPEK